MTYLDWNDAIARYYFHSEQAGRLVTFYIDRRRIEEIGQGAGLGGWEDYLNALRNEIHTLPGRHYLGPRNPMLDFQRVLERWEAQTGQIEGRSVRELDFPPTLAIIAFLVLAWTEPVAAAERSYYGRLQALVRHYLPAAEPLDEYVLTCVAQALIGSFQLIKEWLENTHGKAYGQLMLGKKGPHRYVGAIRYHTLLDPEERALLPALWTEMGIEAHANIDPRLLVENALVCTWFDNYFPKLYAAIQQNEHGQGELVGELMWAEYHAWDGKEMDYPGLPKGRRVQPRIWIVLENHQPSRVMVESRMNWGRLEDPEGNAYHVKREGNIALGVLVHEADGSPVLPDAHWLFEALALIGEGVQIQRAARHHFWAWPALNLGWPGGGYIESSQFLGDSVFKVVVQPPVKFVLDNWRLEPATHKGGNWIGQSEECAVYRGSYPAYNPFNPTSSRRISTPEPRLKLVGGSLINKDLYHAELPPTIKVVNTAAAITDAYLEPLAPEQPGVTSYHIDAQQVGFHAVPFGPVGKYQLVVALEGGQTLHTALDFRLSRPISARHELPRVAYDATGKLVDTAERASKPVFLHHHVHRGEALPDGVARYYLAGASNVVPELPDLGLGHMLVAAGVENGRVPVTRYKELVRELEARLDYPEMSPQEVQDLRRAMESLGFLHYDYAGRWLLLAPMRICRLPDDRHRIRALLLGMVPAAVTQFLYEWSRQADRGISFRWIWQEKPLVPPILELVTMDFACLQRMAADLNARFPLSMLPPVATSLSETLLHWLQPYPRIRLEAYTKLQQMHSFPDGRLRWDAFQGGWKLPEGPAEFPVLTRSNDKYHHGYECEWWPDPGLGVPITHIHAIPLLHQAHGRPHIAVDAQRTDTLLLVGAHRQMHLLERALVLASGQLPTRMRARDIPTWADQLHPDAPVRRFQGIRAPLRAQLCRIFQHSLDLTSAQPIPHVHLNHNHGKSDQL